MARQIRTRRLQALDSTRKHLRLPAAAGSLFGAAPAFVYADPASDSVITGGAGDGIPNSPGYGFDKRDAR